MLSKYLPNEIAHESLPDPAWPLSVAPQRLVGLTKILLALMNRLLIAMFAKSSKKRAHSVEICMLEQSGPQFKISRDIQ